MKKIFFLLMLGSLAMQGLAQEKAYPLTTVIWKMRTIPVCWETPGYTALKDSVRFAVEGTWSRHSSLKFSGWTTCQQGTKAGIRIKIEDTEPMTAQLGSALNGKENGMILNFTFKNWCVACRDKPVFSVKAIAIHEFGHALGFAHEQNRPDCKFQNCERKEQGQNGDWYISPCDENSVMNYCAASWNNNGSLSSGDVKILQHFYGRSGNRSSEFLGPQLVYTSQIYKIKHQRDTLYQLKLYVTASDSVLNSINEVNYYLLDKTFKRPRMTAVRKNDFFGVGLIVWGEFKVFVDIIYKNETSSYFIHDLTFVDKFNEGNSANHPSPD